MIAPTISSRGAGTRKCPFRRRAPQLADGRYGVGNSRAARRPAPVIHSHRYKSKSRPVFLGPHLVWPCVNKRLHQTPVIPNEEAGRRPLAARVSTPNRLLPSPQRGVPVPVISPGCPLRLNASSGLALILAFMILFRGSPAVHDDPAISRKLAATWAHWARPRRRTRMIRSRSSQLAGGSV